MFIFIPLPVLNRDFNTEVRTEPLCLCIIYVFIYKAEKYEYRVLIVIPINSGTMSSYHKS